MKDLKLPLIDNYKKTFYECFQELQRKGIQITNISEKINATRKEKDKLYSINLGRSSGNKDLLLRIVDAYPEILRPFLNIEGNIYETENKVDKIEGELTDLKERVKTLEFDQKRLYELIIQKGKLKI